MDFYNLNLSDPVLDALDDMNFQETTPIQEHAIPPILEGHDLLGVAQTGTGKTAAYLLPVLSELSYGDYPTDAINCVIMSPTRELAQQIDQALQGFSYPLPYISSVAVYGGNDGIRYEQEKRSMQQGADIVIATPGRLISHLSLGNIDLSRVSFFILDEADRMLDMGFADDILQIAKHLPAKHQTIMFSATMPEKIRQLAKTLLKIYRREQFDFLFHYTIKSVIYGSWAARNAGIPQIPVITGLGYTFLKKNLLNRLVISLYKRTIRSAESVWFLNQTDQQVFTTLNILPFENTRLINGEGVDTKKYHTTKQLITNPFTF